MLADLQIMKMTDLCMPLYFFLSSSLNLEASYTNTSIPSASSTQSMTSSMLEMVYENGRRYHRKTSDQYALPSDEIEQDRLDQMHHVMLTILGGELHSTKLEESPTNVLDCGTYFKFLYIDPIRCSAFRVRHSYCKCLINLPGTGTGIWSLDFGEIHPSSQVIGVDLMPIQPSWVYPNVRFETDDLEKDWTFTQSFDFIHSRMIQTSIRDWPRYLKQAFDALNPGGHLELCEHILSRVHCDDETGGSDSAMTRYMTILREALIKMGTHPDLGGPELGKLMEEAGFVDVDVKVWKVPMGHWAKEQKQKRIGWMFGEVLRSGIEAHGLAIMTQLMGMTREEADVCCKEATKVVVEAKEHWYAHIWTVSGRKPEA